MRQNWQLWEGELSEEECNQIIALGLSKPLSGATIFSSSNVYEVEQNFRNTQICWLSDSYIKNIAMDYIMKANRAALTLMLIIYRIYSLANTLQGLFMSIITI